ncbi:hypothetical protein KR52_05805 [Synechococcus sp. KORDI-52]|uniref:hypothetical protein n=1 Tax=Synechococcus sp. KORDI-52 TaxID=585425 RepID=UPI0004E08935|nr:hypothetical protein [Synechococcus sp. KORDI-52]AII48656.1 hypothetical protein KR52_05805 [Synechococcus sp. KORDI-52]
MNDTTALIEARKASADWHGISVQKHLVLTGQMTLDSDRDGQRIKAMGKKYRPAALREEVI